MNDKSLRAEYLVIYRRSYFIAQSKDSKGQSRAGSDIYLVIKRSEFRIKGDSLAAWNALTPHAR